MCVSSSETVGEDCRGKFACRTEIVATFVTFNKRPVLYVCGLFK
jgi:hypothetical protein